MKTKSSSKLGKQLLDGESVLWEGRPSKIAYFVRSFSLLAIGLVFAVILYSLNGHMFSSMSSSDYIILILGILLLLLLRLIDKGWGTVQLITGVLALIAIILATIWWIAFIPAIVGLIAFFIDYVKWSHTIFAITDRRIITQTGLFSIEAADIQTDRVQNCHSRTKDRETHFRFR